jgi:hypothetical protein
MTLSLTILSIISVSITEVNMTLGVREPSTISLSIVTHSIITLSLMALYIAILSIMTPI